MSLRWMGLWSAVLVVSACTINIIVPTPTAVPTQPPTATAPAVPTATAVPTSTAVPPTATAVPTPTAVPPTAVPTPLTTVSPTATPRPDRGLGISAEKVREFAGDLGFIFETKSDRMIAWGGPINVILIPPYGNLSKAHLVLDVESADDLDVLDTILLLVFFTGEGDITWMFQDILDGRPASRTFGDVRVSAELLQETGALAITITPK